MFLFSSYNFFNSGDPFLQLRGRYPNVATESIRFLHASATICPTRL